MGRQALASHSSETKHKEHLKRVATFFKPKSSDSKYKSFESSFPTLSKVQITIDVSVTNAEALKAEIMWPLYCVKNYYLNNSLIELIYIFKDVL